MNLVVALRRLGCKDGHKQRDRREGRPRVGYQSVEGLGWPDYRALENCARDDSTGAQDDFVNC
jgi:hypothetical protein